MTWAPENCWLVYIVIEGAVDRFCGRPRDQNPYARVYAGDHWEAWDFGWTDAGDLLEDRGEKEARRWLGEAA